MRKTAILCAVIIATIATSLTVSLQASGQNYNIPSWIKNNAKWWAEDQIGEEDFLKSIEYLADKKIILIDYDPIYENPILENEPLKIRVHGTIPDAIKNLIPIGKQYRIDIEGQVEGYSLNKELSVTVIFPDESKIDISPNHVSIDGNYRTSGVKIFPNSQAGIYRIITELDGKIVKNQYFFIQIDEKSRVPSWIKNIASLWSEGKINDSDFIFGIKYLIKENIIDFERKYDSRQKFEASKLNQISPMDIKPVVFSFHGDKLEAFLKLKKGNLVELVGKSSGPYSDTYFQWKTNNDGIVRLPDLPYGEYEIRLNNYRENFVIDEAGHNSTILKTVTDDGKVLCLGAFISVEECSYHKSVKKQPMMVKIGHSPEWYETKFRSSYDFDDYYFKNFDYNIDYDTDVKYLLNRANHYAQQWVDETEIYAGMWVDGKISYDEYERKAFSAFDYYSDLYVKDFDNYWDSKYPYP